MKKTIRISCAGLSSIKIDDKYLLVQNAKSRNRGKIIYGPLGGALEYHESIKPFLQDLDFKPERTNRDLRIHIPIKFTNKFNKWFSKREDREISNYREMYEELVLEEKVIDEFRREDITETLVEVINFKRKSPFHKTPSLYYFEIFKIELLKELEEKLKTICEDDKSTIKLFTKEEIESGNNGEITTHSKYILI